PLEDRAYGDETFAADKDDPRHRKAGVLQLDALKERLKEALSDPKLTDEERKKFQKDLAELNALITRRVRERDNGEPSDITAPEGPLGDARNSNMSNAPGVKGSAKQGVRG